MSRLMHACRGCDRFVYEGDACPFCGHERVLPRADASGPTSTRIRAMAVLLGAASAVGCSTTAQPAYGVPVPADSATTDVQDASVADVQEAGPMPVPLYGPAMIDVPPIDGR